MAERPNLELSRDLKQNSTYRTGSERFAWKSYLAGLGLTVAGGVVGFALAEGLPKDVSYVGLRALIFGAGAMTGFALATMLVSGVNIFKEDVIYLRGHGELHSKSPSLLPRS